MAAVDRVAPLLYVTVYAAWIVDANIASAQPLLLPKATVAAQQRAIPITQQEWDNIRQDLLVLHQYAALVE